ncbi:MAG: enolase C-terminal domain-like protein [Luteolibacter sp.]|jgi:O-succinylbenzoate synthase
MNQAETKPLISRYRLKARGFLNSISKRREFEGVLIQLDGGFACLHPWPELGDPPLEKCLADLKGARRWPVVKRAIRCAQYDRAARENEDSLFEDMDVPDSHATLAAAEQEQVAAAQGAGFGIIKVKFGHDHRKEAEWFNEAIDQFPTLRWRLDFNEAISSEQAGEFLKWLEAPSRHAIDFIEDPCPYSPKQWSGLFRQFRVPLAVDRESSPHSEAAQVMVIKPAVDEPLLLAEAALQHQQRIVVTSYMEHPVGQAFAAWEAARLNLQLPGAVGISGLQTQHLFEPDAFAEMLGEWSPTFTPPPGSGIGFDDLFETLPWTRLY